MNNNKIAVASLVFSILTFVFLIFGGITCGLYYRDVFPGITKTLNDNNGIISTLSSNLMALNCDTKNIGNDGYKMSYNCKKPTCVDYYGNIDAETGNQKSEIKYICSPGTEIN